MERKLVQSACNLEIWCCQNNREDLLHEWDNTKNVGIMPCIITYGSKKKVWWLCKNKHSYESGVVNRTKGNQGCPYCSNHKVLQGFNDLETWCIENGRTELVKEWHPTKNGELKPTDFTKSSNKSVWWLLPYDDPVTGKHFDFEWEARIQNRTDNNSGCPYLTGSKVWTGYNDFETWCRENTKMDFLDEWDYEANEVKPSEVVSKSSVKIHWRCKEGHVWTDRTADRILKNSGCPYCSLNRIQEGINDFATTNPSLLEEWDYEKNGNLLPTNVMRGSCTDIYWKCKTCGYSWKTRINKRAGHNDKTISGCPACEYVSNQGRLKVAVAGVNDFESWCIKNQRQDLLEEWDFENNKYAPNEVTYASKKEIYWKCKKGHNWTSELSRRTTAEYGCPYCSNRRVWTGYNDLATTHPELVKKWDYQLNKSIQPTKIIASSKKNVHWVDKCGHRWTAIVANMAYKGDGCPICSGRKLAYGVNDFKTWCIDNHRDELLKEWDYNKNKIQPYEYHPHTSEKVWWICSRGHSYHQSIGGKTGAKCKGCPKCTSESQTSFPEFAILYYLKDKGITAEHSYKELGYELDVFIPEKRIGIEFDGSHWHKNKTEQDLKKNKQCKEDGIVLYRVRIDIPALNDSSVDYCCMEDEKEITIQKMLQDIFNIPFDVDFNRDNIAINQLREFTEKENSLAIKNQELAAEWHPTKNGKLTPDMFAYGSGQYVWWLGKCGHEWKMAISSRNKGSGCPYCTNRKVLKGFNDLATKCPDLLEEWDYKKNDVLPAEILYGTSRKVWWVCSECGHSWQTNVDLRAISKHGCPVCAMKKNGLMHRKSVICVETGIIYNSAKEASCATGISATSIRGVCGSRTRNHIIAGGYHWKYIDE